MKNNMIQAWKNADKSANFDAPLAGVSVNEAAMLHDITGGASSGYVCGVSADANGGKSCGGSVRAIANALIDMFFK